MKKNYRFKFKDIKRFNQIKKQYLNKKKKKNNKSVGGLRLRGIFKKADESSPSIIFIDELDAIAPFIVDLHKNNNRLYTFMFNNRTVPYIASSYIHEKIFNEYTKVLNFFPKYSSKLFLLDYSKKISCILKFIVTMVLFRIKYKNIHVFINWPYKGKNQSYKHNFLYRIIILTTKIIKGKL